MLQLATAVPGQARVKTIAAVAGTRDNNFTALRFLAATAVIWFHSYALTLRSHDEPVFRLMSAAFDVGLLGVVAFFAISGFLVTRSFTERRSALAFVIARALRIYPGLIAATLFTIAVGALCSTLPAREFMVHPATRDYLWHTASGRHISHALPGTFLTNPYPHSVNGSLWTLPMELKMYVGCLAAGVLTLLHRRWLFNLCFVAAIAFFAWRPEWFPVNPGMWAARQLGLAFACGAFAWINRDWIPVNLLGGAGAVALLAFAPRSMLGVSYVPIITYVVLWLALWRPVRPGWLKGGGDYSYGLYIYAFPIQQALILAWPTLHPVAVFALAFPLTLALAIASWHFVEHPALALKSGLGAEKPGRRARGTRAAQGS